MTKKHNPASRTNDSKTKTRNGVKRITARKVGQLKSVTEPAAHQRPRPRRSRLHVAKAKRLTSLQCCERQVARPSRRWRVRRSGNPIRSAVSLLVWCAKSSALLLFRQTVRMGASTGLWTARRQQRRSAMRPTRPVARKATKMSLDDEIAHLRDLDFQGLRARWKSLFRGQPPPHLPRHLLFAVLAYRLQANELGDLDPATARLLKQIATSGGSPEASRRTNEFVRRRAELKPGTILTREWNAQIHRVMVADEGFAWNGKTYDSLSKVAFAITGTNWNGPRFFGLRDKISPEAKA